MASHAVPDSSAKLPYRSDIDGLRAVAVLGVLLFHTGTPGFSGGFVGVDVFFVISGYLITGILVKEMATGQYSVLQFYARRARRILPALITMLGVSLAIAWTYLLPIELSQLAHHGLGTLLFVSNLFLYWEAGYFDVAADLKPFLHTWSIAVEEQFYIFWPWVLLFTVRRSRWLKPILLTTIVVSFFWASKKVQTHPSQVFFLMQGRAWELLLGAGLALSPWWLGMGKLQRAFCSILGLALILGSYGWLNEGLPFPAWNALWPCVGAALLIAAGPEALVNRLILQSKPLVFIGLISYSLYLWHWPLLAFIRIDHLGVLPGEMAVAALASAFVMATLSWRFVEQPFRQVRPEAHPGLALGVLGGAFLIALVVVYVLKSWSGFPERMPISVQQAQNASQDVNPAREACHLGELETRLPTSGKCLSGAQGGLPTVLLWGDSHAEALLPGVAMGPVFAGHAIRQMTKTSCPPLVGGQVLRGQVTYAECAVFNDGVLAWLASPEAASIEIVILLARWPVYLFQSGFGIPDETLRVPRYALVEPIAGLTRGEAFKYMLGTTLQQLQAMGKRPLVVGVVPEMRVDIPSCVARKRWAGGNDQECGQIDLADRTTQIDELIRRSTSSLSVRSVFPSQALCPEGACQVADTQGRVLYYDHNHLSVAGAKYVAEALLTERGL